MDKRVCVQAGKREGKSFLLATRGEDQLANIYFAVAPLLPPGHGLKEEDGEVAGAMEMV